MTTETDNIKYMIKETLIEKAIKVKPIGINAFLDYDKAKEIIKQYYPDYYDKGMRIAREMIGV